VESQAALTRKGTKPMAPLHFMRKEREPLVCSRGKIDREKDRLTLTKRSKFGQGTVDEPWPSPEQKRKRKTL